MRAQLDTVSILGHKFIPVEIEAYRIQRQQICHAARFGGFATLRERRLQAGLLGPLLSAFSHVKTSQG
jgi:hypothetical protein